MSFIARKFSTQEVSLLNLGGYGIPESCIPRHDECLYAVDEGRNAILVPLEPEYTGRPPDGYADPMYALVYERETFLFTLLENRLIFSARRYFPEHQAKQASVLANEAYLALTKESEAQNIILIDAWRTK